MGHHPCPARRRRHLHPSHRANAGFGACFRHYGGGQDLDGGRGIVWRDPAGSHGRQRRAEILPFPEPSGGVRFNPTNRTLSGTPTTSAPAQSYTYTVTDSDETNPDSATLTFTIAIAPAQAPTPAATAGDGEVTLRWDYPTFNGKADAGITGWELNLDEGESWSGITPASATTPSGTTELSYTHTGLTNGVVHKFSIRAVATRGYDTIKGGASEPVTAFASTCKPDDIWCAGLTAEAGNEATGYDSSPGSLWPATFEYLGTTYTVMWIIEEASQASRLLRVKLSPEATPDDLSSLTLHIGADSFALEDATSGDLGVYWDITAAGVVLSDGASYVVRLPTPPTPAFADDSAIPDQTFVWGAAITALELPEATGGNGALTYSLSPEPPAGLSFSSTTRTLSGAPATSTPAATYTYTVADSDDDETAGDTDTLSFSIGVAPGTPDVTATPGDSQVTLSWP